MTTSAQTQWHVQRTDKRTTFSTPNNVCVQRSPPATQRPPGWPACITSVGCARCPSRKVAVLLLVMLPAAKRSVASSAGRSQAGCRSATSASASGSLLPDGRHCCMGGRRRIGELVSRGRSSARGGPMASWVTLLVSIAVVLVFALWIARSTRGRHAGLLAREDSRADGADQHVPVAGSLVVDAAANGMKGGRGAYEPVPGREPEAADCPRCGVAACAGASFARPMRSRRLVPVSSDRYSESRYPSRVWRLGSVRIAIARQPARAAIPVPRAGSG